MYKIAINNIWTHNDIYESYNYGQTVKTLHFDGREGNHFCSARNTLETPGIDKYDKISLLVINNRWLTQIHLVAPGGLSLSKIAMSRRGRPRLTSLLISRVPHWAPYPTT